MAFFGGISESAKWYLLPIIPIGDALFSFVPWGGVKNSGFQKMKELTIFSEEEKTTTCVFRCEYIERLIQEIEKSKM